MVYVGTGDRGKNISVLGVEKCFIRIHLTHDKHISGVIQLLN